MEDEEGGKDKFDKFDKLYNPNGPFYCHTCKIYCTSLVNLQTHFLGVKHKAVEEALKAHGIDQHSYPSGLENVFLVVCNTISDTLKDSGEPVKPPESLPDHLQTDPEKGAGRTLEEQLNACKDTEPAIGLQYIIEYRSKDNPIYECHLCFCQAGLTNMLMHVWGIKHRMAYLKKHHPEIGEVKGRGSKLNLRLREIAAKIEQEEGRKPIRSTMDLPIPKDDAYSVQFSDSLVTWFTEDDPGEGKKKEDPKSAAKETDKKDEEESKAKGDDSNKSEDKKESEQSTAQQQNALLFENDSDSDEFTTNDGLLKYLKSFEIVDEDDAAFILKVTQKLTDALILYREKSSEIKNVSEQNQYGNVGDHSEQRTSVGASGPHSKYDFSQWELPVEQSFEDTGTNSSAKIPAKRKASELPTNPSKDKVKSRKVETNLSKDKFKTGKVGTSVSTFNKVPNRRDFCKTERPEKPQGPRATFRDARCLNASRGPDAASRDFRKQKAAPIRDASYRNFKRKDVPSSLQNQSGRPPSVPSKSESNVIGKFFSSVRNMEVDEVGDTLEKIATSNPAFSGMDVQKVIKILIASGTLKPKKTTIAS